MSLNRRATLATLAAATVYAKDALGVTMADESAARKQRSEAVLAREGVPFIAHLPMLQPVSGTRFRSAEETANRALSLSFVAEMGVSGTNDLAQRLVDEWGVRAHLTPNERRFIGTRTPTMHDRAQFSWRWEGVSVLMWALSFPHEIGRPDHVVDVNALVTLIQGQGPTAFRANARLRDRAEILDVLDLTYRYHWAVVDARLRGADAPAGLDGGVVMERHYALNWLTCYADQEWDDVSTDT